MRAVLSHDRFVFASDRCCLPPRPRSYYPSVGVAFIVLDTVGKVVARALSRRRLALPIFAACVSPGKRSENMSSSSSEETPDKPPPQYEEYGNQWDILQQ